MCLCNFCNLWEIFTTTIWQENNLHNKSLNVTNSIKSSASNIPRRQGKIFVLKNVKNHLRVQWRWWSVSSVFVSSGVWVIAVTQVHHHQSSLALFPVLIAWIVVLPLPISIISISLPFRPSDHHTLSLLHLWDTHKRSCRQSITQTYIEAW